MCTKIKTFNDITERDKWLIRECIASSGFCTTNINWYPFKNDQMSGLISQELYNIITNKQMYPYFSAYLYNVDETKLIIAQYNNEPNIFRFSLNQKLIAENYLKEFKILIRGKYELVQLKENEIVFI